LASILEFITSSAASANLQGNNIFEKKEGFKGLGKKGRLFQ
jgi:hypothetical protein